MKARSRSGVGGAWLLFLLCLALGSWVYWVLAKSEEPSAPARQPKLTLESSGASLAGRDLGLPPLEDLTETLERPIFLASRRPAEAAAAVQVESGPAIADDPLSLRGVIISSIGRTALLQVQNQDRPVWVGEGESLGGWQVDSILSDRVTLSRGSMTRDLKLKDEPSRVRPKRKKRQSKDQQAVQDQQPGAASPVAPERPSGGQREEAPAEQ